MKNDYLYSPENFRKLARLLVKTWKPTQVTDPGYEAIARADFLAGFNSKAWEFIETVVGVHLENC